MSQQIIATESKPAFRFCRSGEPIWRCPSGKWCGLRRSGFQVSVREGCPGLPRNISHHSWSHSSRAGATFAKITEQLLLRLNRLGTAVKFARGSGDTARSFQQTLSCPGSRWSGHHLPWKVVTPTGKSENKQGEGNKMRSHMKGLFLKEHRQGQSWERSLLLK